MSIGSRFWVRASAPLLLCALMGAVPALAKEQYSSRHRRMHTAKRHTVYRPLTVAAPMRAPVADPFGGPAPLITGPVAVGGTLVGLPFRALNTVFPASADPAVNPLVLIGAPIHLAGQLAQLPFYGVGRAFGANPVFPN